MPLSRKHFRIEYPSSDRPALIHERLILNVINLSEQGLAFENVADHQFDYGELVDGTIVFHDKEKVNIRGKVVRSQEDHVALSLLGNISLRKIMSEQRFLINKYGTLKQPDPKSEQES